MTVKIKHDGFEGTIQGRYITREGKRGVVLQQVGTKVVHVYGEKWLDVPLDDAQGLLALADEIEESYAPFADDVYGKYGFWFIPKQARLVVAALRAAPVSQCDAEPVAWQRHSGRFWFTLPENVTAEQLKGWRDDGFELRPLYATPPSRSDAVDVNALLEKIAERFEVNDSTDIWRSDAAAIVRSFKK